MSREQLWFRHGVTAPAEFVLIGFHGDQFSVDIVPALQDLLDTGTGPAPECRPPDTVCVACPTDGLRRLPHDVVMAERPRVTTGGGTVFPQDVLGFLVDDGRRGERRERPTTARRLGRRTAAEQKRHWFS
jgi:hypothetical protein